MRHLLPLIALALAGLTACDDDDPSDVTDGCNLEAAFRVDGDERCAAGFAETTALAGGGRQTLITLTGPDPELLTISVDDLAEGDNDIAAGAAVYVDGDGDAYVSLAGGLLTAEEITADFEGDFAFDAVGASGDTVSVTDGVIENLRFR